MSEILVTLFQRVRKWEILFLCLAFTLITGKTRTAAACFSDGFGILCILGLAEFHTVQSTPGNEVFCEHFCCLPSFFVSQRKLILSPVVIFDVFSSASCQLAQLRSGLFIQVEFSTFLRYDEAPYGPISSPRLGQAFSLVTLRLSSFWF